MDELRDALSAAYDKVEENVPDAGQGDAVAREEPQAPEGAPPAEAPERVRDEQGRFTTDKAVPADGKDKPRQTLTLKGKADAQEKPERPADEAPAKPGAEAQPTAGGNQPSAPGTNAPGTNASSILPPDHWLGAAKKHWDRLPTEVRESIHRDGQQFAQAQGLNQALAPYSQVLAREFGGADRGVAAILNTWGYARERPLDFVREFMQNRGIDPRMLAGEAPQAQPSQVEETSLPPAVIQRIQQLEAAVQTVQQQPLIAQQNQIQTEVQSFGAAVNPDGSIAHPYFNDVKHIMASFMGSGTAKTLNEAYDMAVYANPAIRADLMATEQAKQADQRRRAAEAAKGAAASIAGSPGHSGPGKAQNETVGATLERAWDQAISGRRA